MSPAALNGAPKATGDSLAIRYLGDAMHLAFTFTSALDALEDLDVEDIFHFSDLSADG